jgi:hypothetical protein
VEVKITNYELRTMNNPTPTENPTTQSANPEPTSTSPVRCLSGAVISGGIASALYSLTAAIAQNFAAKPVHSDNPAVINIAVAVRTLVVGMAALATGIFGLVALGLVALAIQISIQRITKRSTPPSDVQ